ncbi:uncharacterized protein V6R79_007790 [Siganus canaliculatus]
MKTTRFCLILCVLLATSQLGSSNFLVLSGIAGAGLLAARLWPSPAERCDLSWINFRTGDLEVGLQNKLFGQHIASHIILQAVKGFMNHKNPQHPLVLSLHGWTGTGKNFATQLIAESIYKKGTKSQFYHLFSAIHHFPDPNKIELYKSQIQQWVRGNVTKCERSMFVFDEMDKMHPGLIDSIKPFLEYYSQLDGVSYRKSIFIFLSNAGGNRIINTALDFINSGRKREEIQPAHLETPVSLSVFNNKHCGLWHASVIDKNLVDYYVPFLPLEYQHVIQCILAAMRAQRVEPDLKVAEQVIKDLVFFPESDKLFSVKGCKTVESKLYFHI